MTVTSAANRARLAAIRAANLRLAAGDGNPPADQPAIVWMSYNVHGNEAVSSNAVLDVLYRLLTDPAAQRDLERTVVVLDPCINPDGYNRYVSWYGQMVGAAPNAAPDAREHREPWPGGRANHYLFDLNRDWAWGTQAETRQRVAAYRRWMPHVHADYHEQGVDSPYYFAPAAEPFHPAVTPWQRELQTRIGRANAATFDRRGELYFTREVFDLFYPSYGDTWPTFNGAVGMTFEQGGSGGAGLAIETTIGDTLTLGDRIANHVATSLNNVAVAARDREEVVSGFARYFASEMQPARESRGRNRSDGRNRDDADYRSFVVRAANGPERLAALTRVLDHNGITYGRATARVSGDGYDYRAGRAARVSAEPGDLVVSTAQPAGRLAFVLFEPEPALGDSLTYDVTAWALPFAHGLDAVALRTDVPAAAMSGVAAPPVAAASGAYAYAVPWTSLASARALARLHAAGVRVRSAQTAFEQNGRTFAPGTVLATRADNARLGARFDALVADAVRAAGAESVALATGGAARGADLGSGSIAPLRAPRIVVASGPSVQSAALGEVWHMLDASLGVPATLVDAENIDASVLARADVLVLPAGRYTRAFDADDITALGAWIEGGGTVVALESAAGLFAGRDGYRLVRKDADAPRDTLADFGGRERRGLSQSVPGAVYRATLDATHPLAFGYTAGDSAATVPVLWRSDDAYAFLSRGWNVGTFRGDARMAGFTGSGVAPRLRDALVYGVEEKGDGAVVYLLDGPLFRGFWEGTQLVFANAIFRF